MGQYHIIINDVKQQYLHPHKFGDGLKLMEFGNSSCGTLTALAVLLAEDNGKGGGDLRNSDPLIGSWSGDTVRIVGDYGPDTSYPEGTNNAYSHAQSCYEDISEKMIRVLAGDSYLKKELASRCKHDHDRLEPETQAALGYTAIKKARWKPDTRPHGVPKEHVPVKPDESKPANLQDESMFSLTTGHAGKART